MTRPAIWFSFYFFFNLSVPVRERKIKKKQKSLNHFVWVKDFRSGYFPFFFPPVKMKNKINKITEKKKKREYQIIFRIFIFKPQNNKKIKQKIIFKINLR